MSENKQEKRETLADIVADMRKAGALMTAAYMRDLLNYADRIEAAWRQEKAEWESAACTFVSDAVMSDKVAVEHVPVGNAAALREALKTIHDKVNSLDEECGVDPVEIRDITRAALSEPARNCDVMSMSICTKHFSTIYEGNRDGLCDVQTEREKNIHLYYIAFNKWLFAQAAERKGATA